MSNSAMNTAAKVAQLAKAAADIIKGALSGGLHGAAIGAVKAFAPQLVKIVFVLIILLFMLPIIIFVALPSALFGFESVGDEMTIQAEVIDKLYSDFDTLTNEAASIITLGLGAGYDDVEVTQDFNSLSYNRVAAIVSVYYQQDVNTITKDNVINIAKQNIEYSYETHTYEIIETVTDEETGNTHTNIVTKKRISIKLWDIGADKLMEKLGFNKFQKEWADFIYQNLEERQTVDGEYTPEDLGNLTFTDGSTDVVYYNQKDVKWGDLSYGTSDNIAESGCGPTALAIVVSSLTDTKINPKEMADWAYENGYYIPNGGSYHSLIPEGAEHYGLFVTGARANEGQKIIDALSNGKLVIAIMGKGTFTSTGHFIVLRGVTSEGKILVADPFSINYSNKEWDLSLILNEASKRASSGGPFWLIGGGEK